jgi:hypothetical protein
VNPLHSQDRPPTKDDQQNARQLALPTQPKAVPYAQQGLPFQAKERKRATVSKDTDGRENARRNACVASPSLLRSSSKQKCRWTYAPSHALPKESTSTPKKKLLAETRSFNAIITLCKTVKVLPISRTFPFQMFSPRALPFLLGFLPDPRVRCRSTISQKFKTLQ